MKIMIYILLILALASAVYNSTHLDLDTQLSDDNLTALIGILAASCVIVLLFILLISRKIAEKSKS